MWSGRGEDAVPFTFVVGHYNKVTAMTLEEHTLNLGKLIVNLHLLEFNLRAFLCEAHKELILIPNIGQKSVTETHLTNYDSLGQLIRKYNDIVTSANVQFLVDKSVVELRDALAHGRMMARTSNPPLRIFKFNKPSNGLVDVTYDQTMDQQWYDYFRKFVYNQVEKVRGYGKQLGFSSFS